MFVWCTVLFALGILAFLDSIYNMGDIFRQVNSVLFMLISLALLTRTTTKIKDQQIENYRQRIDELEEKLSKLERLHQVYKD